MCLLHTAHMNSYKPKKNTESSLDAPRSKMSLVKSRMAYGPRVSVVHDGPPALSWERTQPCDTKTAEVTDGREFVTLVSLPIWCSLFRL